MRQVQFSVTPPKAHRLHYVNQADVAVVLSRLPEETWKRLRGVHFNDRAFGCRTLGYVNRGRHDIALCALPRRLGISALCRKHGLSPSEFGATWGQKWPVLAVRRLMLYEVFLHEVGHLQVYDAHRPSRRLRFYREKLAEEFAFLWRRRLWSVHYDHPDPVHNQPDQTELLASMAEALCPVEQ